MPRTLSPVGQSPKTSFSRHHMPTPGGWLLAGGLMVAMLLAGCQASHTAQPPTPVPGPPVASAPATPAPTAPAPFPSAPGASLPPAVAPGVPASGIAPGTNLGKPLARLDTRVAAPQKAAAYAKHHGFEVALPSYLPDGYSRRPFVRTLWITSRKEPAVSIHYDGPGEAPPQTQSTTVSLRGVLRFDFRPDTAPPADRRLPVVGTPQAVTAGSRPARLVSWTLGGEDHRVLEFRLGHTGVEVYNDDLPLAQLLRVAGSLRPVAPGA